MPFRPITSTKKTYETPVDVIIDTRPRRIDAPYEHQATLLRTYAAECAAEPDIAIQGATGSGKTLVALAIAEWRRRTREERSVYLCPTKQLVHQVCAFANQQLGFKAEAFVGSRAHFPPSAQAAWRTGEVIGVTTYSALFNTNPFFEAPNFIIVDDAHAADQHIGDHWSVHVTRGKVPGLFDELAAIFGKLLPKDDAARMAEAPRALSDSLWTQLIPAPLLWPHVDAITAVLDQAEAGTDLYFRWSVLKGHLRACQVFVSPHEVLFRPVLPPTFSHQGFDGAKQRLYVSATLGRGGELERLSGRSGIRRLEAAEGWNSHGVGRRFFLFPDASLEATEVAEVVDSLIERQGRALVLTTREREAEVIKNRIETRLPGHVFVNAREIEASKNAFVSKDNAVAILANRYDGIDFPGEDCRLLIVEGRPHGASIMERFLADKLGARALFAERIRTRIVQAFGRCTRSATDHALVIPVGGKLIDELYLKENCELFDAELQAEIEFGEKQSSNQTAGSLIELADAFFAQGEDWRSAEEGIVALRNDITEVIPEYLEALAKAAEHEVAYVKALWRGDAAGAATSASQVVEALAGGQELRGYRAYWEYLWGCACALDAENRSAPAETAMERFRAAKKLGGVRWLERLETPRSNTEMPSDPAEDTEAIITLQTELRDMGLRRYGAFTKRTTFIRNGLANTENAGRFEAAHKELGTLLGFLSENPTTDGAPDPYWIIREHLCFVFEDYSRASENTELPIKKARQATLHKEWLRENEDRIGADTEVIPVLLTNAVCSGDGVRPFLDEVVVWPLSDFLSWSGRALDVIRDVRACLGEQDDLFWRVDAMRALREVQATPTSLLAKLRAFPRP